MFSIIQDWHSHHGNPNTEKMGANVRTFACDVEQVCQQASQSLRAFMALGCHWWQPSGSKLTAYI